LVVKQADKTVVLLGAQQLNNTNEVGRVTVGVKKIYVHSTWNPQVEKYKGDIAILMLDEQVTFSSYVQPVCLPKLGSDMKDVTEGVIVGFGKSESSISHENEPKKAFTPIQKSEECFSKFPNLAGISSVKTFCAGNANGTGSCTGDSGGGLTVVNHGRHFLRGIVSASLYATKYGCDVNSYAIFTDMRFYLSFVKIPNKKND
jgi:secreted trypsin-like serine protease